MLTDKMEFVTIMKLWYKPDVCIYEIKFRSYADHNNESFFEQRVIITSNEIFINIHGVHRAFDAEESKQIVLKTLRQLACG